MICGLNEFDADENQDEKNYRIYIIVYVEHLTQHQ